jgi:aspartate-semialdehyde dehydrogenase
MKAMVYELDHTAILTEVPGRKPFRVGIVGATGTVGQQLIRMLKDHPWFDLVTVAASEASAGKTYEEAVKARWCMDFDIPDTLRTLVVQDSQNIDIVSAGVDIIFCAVSMPHSQVAELENAYALKGVWVTSCNSALRMDPLVPIIVPLVNASHLDVIPIQRKARGYGTGAIIVKSNCSIQSFVIPLEPLRDLGIESINVHNEQAISGAGRNFQSWPEMSANIIPFIPGEEAKSQIEPLKLWGQLNSDGFKLATLPKIRAKCVRVGVLDGHTAYVTAKFAKKITSTEIVERWNNFRACEGLPSAPAQPVHYLTDPDRPQPRLDVMTERGMAVSVGQLVVEGQFCQFTGLSHNTILGAAGGAVLATELAVSRNLIYQRNLDAVLTRTTI